MSKDPSSKHIAAAQRRLSHLAGIGGETKKAEQNILRGAAARLLVVTSELTTLRPRVNLSAAESASYQALTLERGQLAIVIANARKALGK